MFQVCLFLFILFCCRIVVMRILNFVFDNIKTCIIVSTICLSICYGQMDKAFVMVIIGLYALGAISFLCLILSELFGEKNELKFLDEGSKRQVKNDVVNKKGVENTNGRDNFEYYDVWEDFDDSKSKLEIGFEYEMYVGHLYEKRGFSVLYNGILMGSRDRGIDLVCIRGRIVHLVQCKR